MSVLPVIAGREMGSMFRLPAGWVIMALYLLLSGIVFAGAILVPGQPASMRAFFALSGWLLMPVVPAIGMRLFSEEYRAGTIEPLMTAPVDDWSLVLGKYVGACGFLVAMLAPTAVFPVTLWLLADPRPELGPILSGYLSLILQGMLYLSIGLLASSLTSNQTLAFLLTLFSILGMLLLSALGPQAADQFPPRGAEIVRRILSAVSIETRVSDFARGVIDPANIVFFVGLTGFVLTLGVVSVQSRRWR